MTSKTLPGSDVTDRLVASHRQFLTFLETPARRPRACGGHPPGRVREGIEKGAHLRDEKTVVKPMTRRT